MRKLLTLLLFVIPGMVPVLAQTTYTATSAGNWDTAGTWDVNGIPPDPLPAADAIVIACTPTPCTVTNDTGNEITIDGDMTVQNGTTLDMQNENLLVGDNDNDGHVTVDVGGTIIGIADLVAKRDVLPDGGPGGGPFVTNSGDITAVDIPNIGQNSGGGILTNNATGLIVVTNGNLHVDGTIINDGCLEVDGDLFFHGAVVSGSGKLLFSGEVRMAAGAGAGGAAQSGPPSLGGTLNMGSLDPPPGCSAFSEPPSFDIDGCTGSWNDVMLCLGNLTNGSDYLIGGEVAACGRSANVALPVELMAFYGEAQESSIALYWTTGTELNNDRFEVERSSDGLQFERLGEVAGNGTSNWIHNYEFIDLNPLRTKNYYRIKQVDFDGQFEYSPVISVNSVAVESFKVYPNPVQNGLFSLQIPDESLDGARYIIRDMTGREVMQGDLSLFSNTTSVSINVGGLQKSTYILQVIGRTFRWQESIMVVN